MGGVTDVGDNGGSDIMSVTIEVKADLRKFDTAITKAIQGRMAQEIKELKIGTQVRPAPFVETGTLWSSASFARGCIQMEKAATRSATAYSDLGRVIDDFVESVVECNLLIWRLRRPRIMLKLGSALTLFIAGVAVICQ